MRAVQIAEAAPDAGWRLDAACRGEDIELFYSEDEADIRRALGSLRPGAPCGCRAWTSR